MEQIIKLQEKHLEMMQLIKGTFRLLTKEHIANHAFSVRLLISTLSRKLKTHLTEVDEALYLVFIDHGESRIGSTIREFIAEMDKTKIRFGDYAQKWLKTT